jgi:Allene oxide cyclase barrel like domain
MRTRIAVATVAAILLVAGVAAFALAAQPHARITQPQMLSFVSVTTSTGFIDADPSGTSTGDQQSSAARLMHHGNRVGSLDANCSFTLPHLICWGVVRLQAGQITVQGMVRKSVLQGKQSTVTIAITGGTGAYRNVHGWATSTPISSDKQRLVLNLLP